MGDAADLVLGIGHEIIALAAAIGQRADGLFAEIDVAVQFAHDQQVDLPGHFGAQGRQVLKAGKHRRGAQVGKQGERLAQAQDRLFGPQVPLKVVARRIAHRAKQDGIARLAQRQGLRRQRVAMQAIRGAAHVGVGRLDAREIERGEHLLGLCHDFRANAVPGQTCDLHCSIRPKRSRNRARAAITSARLSASR